MRAHLLAPLLGLAIAAATPRAFADDPAAPAPASDAATQASPYFLRHAEGWFWYHDPKLEPTEKSEQKPSQPEAPPAPPADDPEAAMQAERHAIDVALDRAILTPTPGNIKAYLVLNQKLMNQASTFSDAWRGTVWTHPELDHRLVSPTGAGAYVQADISAEQREARLSSVAQQWGLLFFFRGSCPYCHKFAPILRQFAGQYGFRVIAITLDGGSLPEFPNPQSNSEAGTSLKVEGVPALYVVNPTTRVVTPAVFGLVDWSELQTRVLYAVDHTVDHNADTNLGASATAALAASGE